MNLEQGKARVFLLAGFISLSLNSLMRGFLMVIPKVSTFALVEIVLEK